VPEGRFRRLLLALPPALAAALIAAPAAHAGFLFPESGGSPNADSIHTLYIMVFVLALFIFAGVEGALFYSLWKYRARKGRQAAQIHGNTKLEVGWTVGAAVILIFITFFTFLKLGAIKDPKPSLVDENGQQVAMTDGGGYQVASTDITIPKKGTVMHIAVNGQQYVWRYGYAGKESGSNSDLLVYTDMVVPVGRTVILDITADDVAHSWWIPKLGGKFDAIPGYTNKTWFQIPPDAIKPGQKQVVFTGQCAELCGANHADMRAEVRAVTPEQFEAWTERQRTAIGDAAEALADERRQRERQDQ
jgi:cytochrome c oxidase subunit II